MGSRAPERPYNPNVLFQPLHGTGAAHRLGTERGRVYRCALLRSLVAMRGPRPLTPPLFIRYCPRACRYLEITMYETLLRPHQVDAPPALTSVNAVGEKLKQSEARREEKRLRQIANARAGAERRAAKRKAEDDGPARAEADGKRARTDGGHERVPPEMQAQDEREAVEGTETAATATATESAPVGTPVAVVPSTTSTSAPAIKEAAEASKICLSKTFPDVRGHTSYLTFAVLLPAAVTRKLGATATMSEQVSSAEPTPPPSGAAEVSTRLLRKLCMDDN